MFTGLIETVGLIHEVATVPASGSRMTIAVPDTTFLADAKLGDSISIDGACTTVIELGTVNGQSTFTIEATPETLSKTTFGNFTSGRKVNLERPLTASSRLGGHFVTGHVDGTANVMAKYKEGNSWIYRFLLDQPELAAYLIPKGSIAINGISLTVNSVEGHSFSVAIIPHTLTATNIDDFIPSGNGVTDTVNIECDMLGKYVYKLLGSIQPATANGMPGNDRGKLYAGPWFNTDEAIHGRYHGSEPTEVLHWPEQPTP